MVKYIQAGTRPFGAGIALFGAIELTQVLLRHPQNTADTVGLVVVLAAGLFYLFMKEEVWECTEDVITYSGNYGSKTTIRWSDIQSVDITGHKESFELRFPTGAVKVASSGMGFPGFLILLKRKTEPQKFSTQVKQIMGVVPDVPPNATCEEMRRTLMTKIHR